MLVTLAVSLLAAGCGGGDEFATDTSAGATTPTPTPGTAATDPTTGAPVTSPGATDPAAGGGAATTPPAAQEEVPGANEISNADAATGQLVKISALTPKKFAQAHCSKPILVVLYQPDSILDAELYAAARTAAKRSGVKDLVTLAFSPRDVKKMGDLPSKVGLLSTPGVATVGRNGTIENFWTTYVDDALIERSIANAAATKPCKVGADDVPAAGSALADATVVANGGTVNDTTTDPLTGTPPGTPAIDAASSTTSGDPLAGGAATTPTP